MFKNLYGSYHAAYRLSLQNIHAKYTKSTLGIFWEFAEPVSLALVFIALRGSQIIGVAEIEIPYALFVTTGIMIFQTFSDSLFLSIRSIRQNRAIIVTIKTTPEVIISSVLFSTAFNTNIRFLVIVLCSMWYGFASPFGLLTVFLILFLTAFIGCFIGFLLAPFNCLYPDIEKAVQLLVRPYLFVSGAIFPITNSNLLATLHQYDCIGVLIDKSRIALATGEILYSTDLLLIITASCMLLIFSWYVFHVSMDLAVERI